MALAIARENWRESRPELWLFLLKLAVSLTLGARGCLTWQADSPIRGLFWHESWWSSPLKNSAGISWDEWAKQSDPYITTTLSCVGLILIAIAIVPWLLSRFTKLRWLLWFGTFLLVVDSFARWVASDYDFGMAIEHSLQMSAPVVLFFFAKYGTATKQSDRAMTLLLLIATGFTFAGHGFYAAGIHPVPLSYQTMTMKLLGCSESVAVGFLLVVGILDILAALALFPKPLRRPALLYCIIWGLMTALARVVSHFDFSAPGWNLDPWLFETAVRTSHWLLPLLVLGMLEKDKKTAIASQ